MQLDTQLFGHPQGIIAFSPVTVLLSNGVGMAFHAKTGKKIDAFDMYALFHNNFGRKHGIQATGYQGNGTGLAVKLGSGNWHGAILLEITGTSLSAIH
jgi:hypothetical protein